MNIDCKTWWFFKLNEWGNNNQPETTTTTELRIQSERLLKKSWWNEHNGFSVSVILSSSLHLKNSTIRTVRLAVIMGNGKELSFSTLTANLNWKPFSQHQDEECWWFRTGKTNGISARFALFPSSFEGIFFRMEPSVLQPANDVIEDNVMHNFQRRWRLVAVNDGPLILQWPFL